MRTIKASAYFGVAKNTLNSEEPYVVVCQIPFSGYGFVNYVWFRTNALLPIHDNVTEVQAEVLQEVTEHPDG